MAKIRILPEQLANQIAAGEVVERPASVVKELLENCLDAGAHRIEIEIEGGGTRLIRVIDNGCGMDEDDLLLCLERHGTSKLAREEDLAAIATLGFRGEAIPSIGSVSQLSISSRPREKQLGSRIVLHYGKLVKAHEIGCSYGTTCEIRNLFGNTPARRKFLRTARTEIGHIDEVVKNYSLCSPNTTFILKIDGRETLSLDQSQSIADRLATILHYDGTFIAVESGAPPSEDFQLTGFLLPPEKVSHGPARLRVFVNGRAIRDRMITHAVTEGMRSFLLKGKNPSGLIHLIIPPTAVDVNVHPAKHEVRFRNTREVHDHIQQRVAHAMILQQTGMKMTIFSADRRVESSPIPLDVHLAEEKGGYDSSPLPPFNPIAGAMVASPPPRPAVQALPRKTSPQMLQPQSLLRTAEPLQKTSYAALEDRSLPIPNQPGTGAPGHNLFVIGQFDNLYIFCRNSDGLLIIDQHAAHERLLYEKLHKQYQSATIVRQTLMFPVTVELSLFQTQLVEKYSAEIERMGFSIRDFGGNTFIISAVPALAGTSDPGDLFADILEQFGSESSVGDKGGSLDTVLASMACKAAVKAGTALNDQEVDKLLSEMVKADLFSHCPHGRPVVKQFSRDEIKKWFYRT